MPARDKLDGWCEKGILGLVLANLIFAALALGGNRVWAWIPIEALTICTMALWAARLWISAKPQFLCPPACWAVLAFMVYAVARYFTADIEYAARDEMIHVLVYGFLFFIVVNNLHRQETTQIIALTLLMLGMAISVYAGIQFMSKHAHVWTIPVTQYRGRGSGTFIYPNHLAGFLEMLVPVGLCYVLIGRFSHVTKIIIGYASVMMLVGVGVTVSRGGWLVTAFMLVVLCCVLLAQRDYRIQGFALLAVLVVGGLLVVPRAQNMMHQRPDQMVASGRLDDLRLGIWKSTIQMWKDHPVWGVGPGEFDHRFPAYRPAEVQLRPQFAHNDYLNTLADWGAVGTAIIAGAWLLLFWGVLRNWKNVRGSRDDFSRKKSSKFAFLIGASAGLLAILAHCVLDFEMQLPANAMVCITLMALLSSQWRFATDRYWFRAGTILKCAASVVLLAGIVYLAHEAIRAGREFRWLRISDQLAAAPDYEHSDARIDALKNALAIESMNPATVYEIGQCYRLQSWEAGGNFAALAKEAIEWFKRGIQLDPYNPDNPMRIGMCIDWINSDLDKPTGDSWPYYQQAMRLDPNNYFVTANTAWHYIQTGDYAAARTWLERSRRLKWVDAENQIAGDYLPIVERRLKEAADKQK